MSHSIPKKPWMPLWSRIIGFRGHTLQWNLPDNTNKLCHRCGKLGCAPNQCPSRQERGRTRGRNPVAALKERFNINQPARLKSVHAQVLVRARARKFLFLRSCVSPLLSTPNQAITMSPHEAANILSLLKSLQQDMAEVRDRITALELNDRRMTRIEQHLGVLSTYCFACTKTSQLPVSWFYSITPVRAPISAPIDLPEYLIPLLPLKRFLPPPKPAMKFKPLMRSIQLLKQVGSCSLTLLAVLLDPLLPLLLPRTQLYSWF
ncbi:hypothetical protein RclHR1_28250002 [Rhizophagus clarus]|uniref:Uncharacterized protein n=1 Tax=Rhizophagus clarus TaxID=94130 RepID=A0A2Z6R407_9GLOM|nr:hypothetical protein RclHR1_28250002 [Rhizophagus clarus]